jgi:hypothetical protein
MRSIELAPNENFTKYMNLGQILQGKEALAAYTKGLELMTNERQRLSNFGVRPTPFFLFSFPLLLLMVLLLNKQRCRKKQMN